MPGIIRPVVLIRAGKALLCCLLVMQGASAVAAEKARAPAKPQAAKTKAMEARFSAVPRTASRRGGESARGDAGRGRVPPGEKPADTATARAVAVNGEWLLMPIVIPEPR